MWHLIRECLGSSKPMVKAQISHGKETLEEIREQESQGNGEESEGKELSGDELEQDLEKDPLPMKPPPPPPHGKS